MEMKVGYIYTDGYMHFVSPDGIGRVWAYGDNGIEKLKDDFGLDDSDVIHVTTMDLADF
jgi:hypothetical protein